MVVGVTSTPFKCPPAPSETAMLMHEFLSERGLRDRSEIALVMPFGRPVPPSPEASAAAILLQRNVPARTRNSPTKLLVPGRPSDDNEKITSTF